jgi:hypothetical protein
MKTFGQLAQVRVHVWILPPSLHLPPLQIVVACRLDGGGKRETRVQFLIPCPVLMAVGLRLPPLALPVEPKRSPPDACLSFYSLAPEADVFAGPP